MGEGKRKGEEKEDAVYALEQTYTPITHRNGNFSPLLVCVIKKFLQHGVAPQL